MSVCRALALLSAALGLARLAQGLKVSSETERVQSKQNGSIPLWKEYDFFRHTYFRNVLTGELQWTRPLDAQALPLGSIATLAVNPLRLVRHDLIAASKVFETRPYHRMEREVDKTDITLIFQGDAKRLHQLKQIAHTWRGPISASLLVLESDIPRVDTTIARSPSFRNNVDINLCVAKKQWPYYPVNALRNHAIQHAVRTDYVFIMDGDEDPVQSMTVFKNDLQAALNSTQADPLKTAFIVTSWQWGNSTWPLNDNEYPATKLSISRLAKNGKAVCKGADFPQAYAPLGLGLDKWLVTKRAREVRWHDRYEPYMVVHKDAIGSFDERFVGWGGNKAIHILKMQLQQIKWFLLPHVFTFTNQSIAHDNAKDHVLPADPDLPEHAAEELGHQFGCDKCTYKECVMNCLNGLNIKDYV